MPSAWRSRSCSGIEVPRRGQLIRVLYSEIGRILNHLLNVTTQAMDVGALTPPLWGFEEREKLMVFYERACGRACTRPISARRRASGPAAELIDDIDAWCDPSPRSGRLEAADRNRIFKQRNVDIGVVSLETPGLGLFGRDGARLGRPGTCARAALRVLCRVRFRHPVGKNGDCYDRYLIRMAEMRSR
jgi:NADH-quinone oxidoreductase subunit D